MKSETKLLAIMAAIVALGGGFLVFNKDSGLEKPPTPSPTPVPLTEERFELLVKGTRNFKGDPNARVTIIECADFQCPSCRRAYDQGVKLLGAELKNVRFGFRHFPIEDAHPFARPAAVASELAARQGKFWEAYAQLMKGPDEELTDEKILAAIKAAGVDMDRFQKERGDQTLQKLVDIDREETHRAGASQTPTFFVHDKQTHQVKILTGYSSLVTELKGIVELPAPKNPKSALMPPGE